jgi:hypothetical protein
VVVVEVEEDFGLDMVTYKQRIKVIDAAILRAVEKGLDLLGDKIGHVSLYYWKLVSQKALEELPSCFEEFVGFIDKLYGYGASTIMKVVKETLIEELERIVRVPDKLRNDGLPLDIVRFVRNIRGN